MVHDTLLSQPCLVCGENVQIDAQPALFPGGRPTWLFKCLNPECPTYQATFDARAYSQAEVERYCSNPTRTDV